MTPRHVCPICKSVMERAFTMKVLYRYDVGYFYCGRCGFLQTEKPHWLDEAYSDAIVRADTGLVWRNLFIARRLAPLILLQFDANGRFLDVAGGTGLLVRLMRDMGFRFEWHDPFAVNVHARGFEHETASGPCELVTAFEVVEHVEDPVAFIEHAMSRGASDTLVFSTELFDGEPPRPGRWWYYTPETGQHISFFQRKTLSVLAERLGVRFYTAGSVHVFSKRRLNLFAFRLSMSAMAWPLTYPARRFRRPLTGADHLELLANGKAQQRP
jgi:hypothetical protein